MKKIYYNPIFGRIFHTLVYCLQKQLLDCKSVLDLGCGPNSPLQYCKNIEFSVGVEAFKPYLVESRKRALHSEYQSIEIKDINFPDKSFDAVIIIEVLEHLSKELGEKILKKAERWAKKKIIVSTPNGYFPMKNVDENKWQSHLSGWTIEDFKKNNFSVKGLSGVKFLYRDSNQVKSMVNQEESNIYQNIRFKPKKFFYILNGLCQIFIYYFPRFSFELFAVKKVKIE